MCALTQNKILLNNKVNDLVSYMQFYRLLDDKQTNVEFNEGNFRRADFLDEILNYLNSVLENVERDFNDIVMNKNLEYLENLRDILQIKNEIKKYHFASDNGNIKIKIDEIGLIFEDLEEYYNDLLLAVNILPNDKNFMESMEKASKLSIIS